MVFCVFQARRQLNWIGGGGGTDVEIVLRARGRLFEKVFTEIVLRLGSFLFDRHADKK